MLNNVLHAVSISSDDSEEEFDVEMMRKELSGSDPSDYAIRVRSMQVQYVISDEGDESGKQKMNSTIQYNVCSYRVPMQVHRSNGELQAPERHCQKKVQLQLYIGKNFQHVSM